MSTVCVTTVTGTVDISVMVGVSTGVGSISPGSAVESVSYLVWIINASRGVDSMLPGCYPKFLVVALRGDLVNDKLMPYVLTSFVLHST